MALYGDYAEHTIYYIVEAVNQFLDPGWLRRTATIAPMSTVEVTTGGFGRRRRARR